MINFDVIADIDSAFIFNDATEAEKILAVQVEKDTRKYVPALTGSLMQRTRVEGNLVIYPAPYSRMLYYGKKMVDSQTGKGARMIPTGSGEVIFRYRKGATLVPSAQDLVFNRSVNPMAQARWCEVSKSANLQKWKEVARKAMLRNADK